MHFINMIRKVMPICGDQVFPCSQGPYAGEQSHLIIEVLIPLALLRALIHGMLEFLASTSHIHLLRIEEVY